MSNIQSVPYGHVHDNQGLAGTELAMTAYGSRDTTIQAVHTPDGTMLAPESGVPYIEAAKSCAWDNYNCKAHPAKGTPLCFGHLRQFIKGDEGTIMGEEAHRLIQYKEQFLEVEAQRKADRAKEKEEHLAKYGNSEVTDGS